MILSGRDRLSTGEGQQNDGGLSRRFGRVGFGFASGEQESSDDSQGDGPASWHTTLLDPRVRTREAGSTGYTIGKSA